MKIIILFVDVHLCIEVIDEYQKNIIITIIWMLVYPSMHILGSYHTMQHAITIDWALPYFPLTLIL